MLFITTVLVCITRLDKNEEEEEEEDGTLFFLEWGN